MAGDIVDSLVSSGAVAWLALGVLGLELVLVLAFSSNRKSMLPFAANALSGVSLILALHAALTTQPPLVIALWLGLGFLAHLGDTLLRLRR